MNNATEQGIAKFEVFKKGFNQDEDPTESDEAYYSDDGSSSEHEVVSIQDALNDGAVREWNNAVDKNLNGLVAMTTYLEKRVQFDLFVTREMADQVLADYRDFPPDQKLWSAD